MAKRTRSDSPDKACTSAHCDRPLRARGLCASHYNQKHQPDRHKTRLANCAYCGVQIITRPGGGRKYGPVCSTKCKTWLATPYCVLPADHWARWYGKSSAWKPKQQPVPVPKMARDCEWCGTEYQTHQSQSKYCTEQCSRKAAKIRRRAREHNAPGEYTWTQVIHLHLLAGKRCSYCDEPTAQPEPDHVVPVSRSGRNDIGNILPCCQRCNGDKGDMTLTEWAEYRARRGKPPVRTVFDYKDKRFTHLMLGVATGTSHRLQTESHLIPA